MAVLKPKPKTGKLDLNVLPWADVYLGDKKLGRTPLEGYQLPEGLQNLTLVNPELGARRPIQVRIRANKTTSQVVDLR